MRRFRRKRRGLWLPVLGTDGVDLDTGQLGVAAFATGGMASPPDGQTTQTVVYPLTTDNAYLEFDGVADAGTSISDATPGGGSLNGIMVKRIVGTLEVMYQQVNKDCVRNLVVGAGFFVAPATQAAGPTYFPTGAPANAFSSNLDEVSTRGYTLFSPLSNTTKTFPWMWQRQWLLANGLSSSTAHPENYNLFSTNIGNNGAQEGPRVDIKSRRHIRPGQRLWLAISIQSLNVDATEYTQHDMVNMRWKYNLRIFGSLTRPRLGGSFR